MTTRDDLVSRLRDFIVDDESYGKCLRMSIDALDIEETISALEAKDAEIARLKAAHFEADDKRCYWQSRADTAESRISDLERQLAEAQTVIAQLDERSAQYERLLIAETERCAVLARLLSRYRKETPLGHQPHMIAHEADAALEQHKEK